MSDAADRVDVSLPELRALLREVVRAEVRDAVQALTGTRADDTLLTTADAGALLGIGAGGVRDAVRRGELAPDGRGARNGMRFRRSTIERLIQERGECYPRRRRAASR